MILRLLILSLLCFGLKAQNISVDDLVFSNDFEEKYIREFKEQSNFLALLLASSGRGNEELLKNSEQRLEEIYQSLKPEKLQNKSAKKKIKKIFKTVQNDLFVRYSLENEFIEVFETGRYNCVSSTAIYALFLEKFNIQYIITQEPEHVYLTAVFEDLNILMEGTDPQGGFLPLTDKLIEAQINSLINRKLITLEELNSPDAGKILDEMFPSNEINLEQLIGVQYENMMVYDFENDNYKSSYENGMKALYFYDCERFRNSLFASAVAYMEQMGFEDENYAKVLATLEKLDSSQTHIEEINRLVLLGLASLQIENKENEFKRLNKQLEKELSHPQVKKSLKLSYALLVSELYFKKGKIDSSFFYANLAMELDSSNLYAPDLLMNSLFKKMDLNNFHRPSDTLLHYYSKYKVYRENEIYLNTFLSVILVDARAEVLLKNYSKAKYYLSRFEELAQKHPNITIRNGLVAEAYSKVAMYEFNRNRSKALKTINRGLKYAPNSIDLRKIKAMMQ